MDRTPVCPVAVANIAVYLSACPVDDRKLRLRTLRHGHTDLRSSDNVSMRYRPIGGPQVNPATA
jgi:hypothetical protein